MALEESSEISVNTVHGTPCVPLNYGKTTSLLIIVYGKLWERASGTARDDVINRCWLYKQMFVHSVIAHVSELPSFIIARQLT